MRCTISIGILALARLLRGRCGVRSIGAEQIGLLQHLIAQGCRAGRRSCFRLLRSFLRLRQGRSGPDRRGMLRMALLGLSLAVLLFPQATGVVGMRRLAEPVACMIGTPRIPSSMPRHPELCLRP